MQRNPIPSMRPKLPQEDQPPSPNKRKKNLEEYAAAATIALAVAAATVLAVKECASLIADQKPTAASADTATKNESGNAENQSRQRFSTTIFAPREQTFEPDAGPANADTATAALAPITHEQILQSDSIEASQGYRNIRSSTRSGRRSSKQTDFQHARTNTST